MCVLPDDLVKKEETVEQCILTSVQLLDYVKDQALHLARTIRTSFPDDVIIRTSATVVLNYYLETDLDDVSSLLSFESSTEQLHQPTHQPQAQVLTSVEEKPRSERLSGSPSGSDERLTELEQLLVDSQVLTPSDSESSDEDTGVVGAGDKRRVLRPALKSQSLSHKRARLAKRVRFLCLTSPSSSSDEERGQVTSSKENSVEVISVQTLGWSVVPFSANTTPQQSTATGNVTTAGTDTSSTCSQFSPVTEASIPFKELSVAPTFSGVHAYKIDYESQQQTTESRVSGDSDSIEINSSTIDNRENYCKTDTQTSDRKETDESESVASSNCSSPSSPECDNTQCVLPKLTTSHVRGDMPILQRKEGTKAYIQRVRPKQKVAYTSDTDTSLLPFAEDQLKSNSQATSLVSSSSLEQTSVDSTDVIGKSDNMGNAHDAKIKVKGDEDSGSHVGNVNERTPNGHSSSKNDHTTPKARHKAAPAAKIIKRSSGVKTLDDLPESHAGAVKELRKKFQDKDRLLTSTDDEQNSHVTRSNQLEEGKGADEGSAEENEYQFPTIFVYNNLPRRDNNESSDANNGVTAVNQPPPLPPKSHGNNRLRDELHKPSTDNQSAEKLGPKSNKSGEKVGLASNKSDGKVDLLSNKSDTKVGLASNKSSQQQQQVEAAITRSISPVSESRLSTKCRSSPNMLQDATESSDAPLTYHRPSVVRQSVSHKGQGQGDSDDDLLLDTSVNSILQHRLETVRSLINGLEDRNKPSTVVLEDFTRSCSAGDSANSALLLDGLTIFINRQLDDVTPELHLKLLQMLASLIENDSSPVIVSRACQLLVNCLQGAVLRSVQEGWGFFTMRRLKRSLATSVEAWEGRSDISASQETALTLAFDVVQSII